MSVDGKEPITFDLLAARFHKLGMTPKRYRRFKLPLAYEDIMNPSFSGEIVTYRSLIAWYRNGRSTKETRSRKAG
jgi:hypothetical protein